ncbi:MAG: GGDEF domain-containing protein [Kofleriaceae bacterium]
MLSVELATSRTRVQVLEEMAVAMLASVQALVLDIDEIGAPALHADLDTLRGRIHAGDDPTTLGDDLARCKRNTLDFAMREREHLATRDAELRSIIDVLTSGLSAITTGAAAYHRGLLDKSARFEAAARLSDLVRMRTAITSEVEALRATVSARQSAETTATAALRREIEQLRAKVETATTAARLDPLTKAANRGAFDDELARRCELAANGEGFALLLADIDHFKQINDSHGHPVGDRVLQALVTFLRDRVRRDDTIARWGGEEFAVILPSASLRIAHGKARAMVSQLANADWAIDQGRKVRFTMSVGVTAWRAGDQPETLIARVDQALYAAKRTGRNRAVKA